MNLKNWNITETFVLGKSDNELACEDILIHTPRFVGVIDSSSGLAPSQSRETLGRLIALETLRAFEHASSRADIIEIVHTASENVKALKAGLGLKARHTGGCFFCVADTQNDTIYRLGDCWFMTDNITNKVTLAVEAPLTEIRVAYLHACLLGGSTPEDLIRDIPERQLLLEYLKVKDNYANSTGNPRCYGVINGDEVPLGFIERHKIAPATQSITIGTDGYPVAASSLKVAEHELSHALAIDPLQIHTYPAPKGKTVTSRSFDDRSFIRIERTL